MISFPCNGYDDIDIKARKYQKTRGPLALVIDVITGTETQNLSAYTFSNVIEIRMLEGFKTYSRI